MVGYYSKPAPEAPRLVQWADRVHEQRWRLAMAGAVILGLLIFLSYFQRTVGLILLVIAAVAMLGVYVIARSQTQYRTHWTRDVRRR